MTEEETIDRDIWPYMSTVKIYNFEEMDDSWLWCNNNIFKDDWCYDLDSSDGWILRYYFKKQEDYARFILTWS